MMEFNINLIKVTRFKAENQSGAGFIAKHQQYNHYTNFLVLVKFHNMMYDYIVITLYKV